MRERLKPLEVDEQSVPRMGLQVELVSGCTDFRVESWPAKRARRSERHAGAWTYVRVHTDAEQRHWYWYWYWYCTLHTWIIVVQSAGWRIMAVGG